MLLAPVVGIAPRTSAQGFENEDFYEIDSYLLNPLWAPRTVSSLYHYDYSFSYSIPEEYFHRKEKMRFSAR